MPGLYTPMVATTRWVQSCPCCGGSGRRYVAMMALDSECLDCGRFYTSALKQAVLNALARQRLALPETTP